MDHEWHIAPRWAGRDEAAVSLGVSPIVAQILYNRGICELEDARLFLEPKLSGLSEPEEYEDLPAAAGLIRAAITDGRPIVVYCDYDVDGVCGAAILWHVLRQAGGKPRVYIPHRVEEGYGLSSEAVDKLADEGSRLLVTVDCGIRDHRAVARANERGMTVIVTDHHEPGEALPSASAVVHPQRRSEVSGRGNGSANLCGAAVAFKLAWAVARAVSGGGRVEDGFREMLVDLTSLVALATIADVVPLLGENRILARFGLERIPQTKLVGLRALLDSAKITGSRVDSYHVGFVLGPRLNAAGRMGHAKEAFELLTVGDRQRAEDLAGYLDRQNRRRQKLEEQITAEAVELAESQGQLTDETPLLVLAKDGWHVGVIGIVASKLVEKFRRPVVMIALDGGRGQGSARSVEGFDINQALERCGEHLLGYGGHAMAAGLQIESGRVIPFMQSLHRHGLAHLAGPSRPVVRIDAEVGPEMIESPFVWQLQRLGPFGHGNPRPTLSGDVAELVGEPRLVGNGGRHLSFSVRWGQRVFRAIAFNQAEAREMLLDCRRCRLAFEPIIDEYLGPQAVQLRVKAIRPARSG
ncbi:MAG: single-stranded-DNA-specific exonuclease RecJ [Phycisphaerae bacterium]|nr:single-stranded-DNA-specific exonuclease RecJ [Phycisphaerae bacterium]